MAIRFNRRVLLRSALIGLLLVTGVLLAVFAVVIAKLDRDIRTRFAGVRWTLPAQVYAAPQELYAGLPLGLDDLSRELRRLGYREVAAVEGPGTYARLGSEEEGAALAIETRAFNFYEGAQPSQKLRVSGSNAAVAEVAELPGGRPVELTRLDPMLIGSIYPARGGEDRALIKLEAAPELFKQGLLAVEDRSFYSHWGVSLRGILRAVFTNMSQGERRQGASTITQQLVKNFFLTSERSYRRKVKEVLMAFLLEVHYSKDEILEAYLNEIYMGQDGARAVHGFGLASQFYFNKPLMELKPQEMAMLVAVVKGPSVYDPRRHPEATRERRNLVLRIWEERGLIPKAASLTARAAPLGLSGGARGGVERYPAFVELVKRQLKEQYEEEAITSEGLHIYTSLNPRVQDALERRIVEDLPALEKARKLKAGTLEAAGVVTSVEGGEVQAVVAGREVRYAGYNRALDSRRSIGSLAKPFVYLAALQEPSRYSLGSTIDDEPESFRVAGKSWRPLNYDRRSHGEVPLYSALAHSYNVPTVKLGMAMGVKAVQRTIRDAGFPEPPANPSIFLGALDMAPLEVAQVYNTLAASGFQTPLSAIREVLTKEGEPLKRYSTKVRQTLPEGPVWLTTWALKRVFTAGTATAALNILPAGTALAGKTGTTDDLRDSWFAGYSADHVGVIWVGRDDYKPSGLTGANGAMPIWARLMRDVNARGLDEAPPADVEIASVGCGQQQLPVMSGFAPPMPDCGYDPLDPLAEGSEAAAAEAILEGREPSSVEAAPSQQAPTEPKDEPSNWLRDIFR